MDKKMIVYTHYNFIGKTGSGYRWRTLLQFGTSWNVIGSIVMMNPGGANFKHSDAIKDENLLSHLRMFDSALSKNEDWYEFSSDQTLNIVHEMFSEWYRINNAKELNGIIQVFNLFYLKDPNLQKGIELNAKLKLDNINDRIFDDDIKNLSAPLYLGFGQLSKKSQFKFKAKCFFDKAIHELGVKYLNPVFEENSFMHPRRLMRFMKNKPEGILLKLQFYHNTISSDVILNEIGNFSLIPLIRNKLAEKSNAKWRIHQGWDLFITFNDGTNKIGIESWFGRKDIEDDEYFHIFITVWNPQCFTPYQQELKKLYPDSIIENFGLKNRKYLSLPVVKSTNVDIIVESLMKYYLSLSEITRRIK